MKKLLVLFCILVPALCHAEIYTHNFHTMFNAVPKTLNITNSNKTGTTDLLTYTCSGGSNACFSFYSSMLCIRLKDSGDKVTTTRIADLDSLDIQYYKAASPQTIVDFKVEISTDSVSWTKVVALKSIVNASDFKMPAKGDYYVRITRKDTDFYLSQITYITKPCYCLRVVSE